MEYEKIKTIIKDMEESKLHSLSIEFPDGTKISMEKEPKEPPKKPLLPEHEELKPKEPKREVEEGKLITSPMVGTFYSKPSPESSPYVSVGSKVNSGDTVCIIEAMKLMNEIESEYTGTILEVLVKDGDIVEFGTPLFRIKE